MMRTESAGGIVINSEGKILVVNQNNNSWSLPKGHVDDNEDILNAAKREIYEESGITELELIRSLGKYQRYKIALNGGEDKSELKTIHMFLFKTDQTKLKPVDPKNPEALWVEKNKVAEILTHKKDKEFFLSAINEII
jgi:8-oxo-dGTP diphosphatase